MREMPKVFGSSAECRPVPECVSAYLPDSMRIDPRDEDYIVTADTHYFWKNCISSIRVAAGWKATLYVDTNFRGKSVEISVDVSNLQLVPGDCDHGGFNDCIESIKIARQ